MSDTDLEKMLFVWVASDPSAVARTLMSPRVNMRPEWFQNELFRSLFARIAELALSRDQITWLSIASGVSVPKEARARLRQLWSEGKAGTHDGSGIIAALKSRLLTQEVDGAIGLYRKELLKSPGEIGDHITRLGSTLSTISYDGEGYDPDPTTHLDDFEVKVEGTWGSRTLDEMYGDGNGKGGVPNSAFVVYSAHTGQGKTTYALTLAAMCVSRGISCVVMSNEMLRGDYSRGVLRALEIMWAGERTSEMLKSDMRRYLKVYEPVRLFERMRQILHWHRPAVAIMDSIKSLTPPAESLRYNDIGQHAAKADTMLALCRQLELFLFAPGNMSGKRQEQLLSKPDTVNSVMLFGSTSYQDSSDYAFVSWRDPVAPDIQQFKKVKDRPSGSIGRQWQMAYDRAGGYYRDNISPVDSHLGVREIDI